MATEKVNELRNLEWFKDHMHRRIIKYYANAPDAGVSVIYHTQKKAQELHRLQQYGALFKELQKT